MISKTYGVEYMGRPMALLAQMKADGFRFDTETCPIKLTEPKDVNPNDDGTVTYTQWTVNDKGEWV